MADFRTRDESSRFMAAIVINVAKQRGDPVVTGELIMEAFMQAFTQEPGTRFHDAAKASRYYETARAVVEQLDATGDSAMVGDDLREARPPERAFKPDDRVILKYSLNSGGTEYPEGSSGSILRLTDPAQAEDFAAAEDYAVRMDRGPLLRIPEIFLEREE